MESLEQLQRRVAEHNDEIERRQTVLEERRKRVRDLRLEVAQRQNVINQQKSNSEEDYKKKLKEILVRQQTQIKQIRMTNRIPEADADNTEQIDVLKQALMDSQLTINEAESLLVNLENFKNNNSLNASSGHVLEKHLHPFFSRLQRYLEANQARVQKTKDILAQKIMLENQLDRQISEMKKKLANQSNRSDGSSENQAKVGPWIAGQRKTPSPFDYTISKRQDVSPNHAKKQPPTYIDYQNEQKKLINSQSKDFEQYMQQLKAKHYPTPLKKRSSISESSHEGSANRYINKNAGFLYAQQYNKPDTLHPEKKDPPPYPGRVLKQGNLLLPSIDDQEESSPNNSPNGSFTLDQQKKAAKLAEEISKNIDETSYKPSEIRKRHEQLAEQNNLNKPKESENKKQAPITPPRTTSQGKNNHPVDLALKKHHEQQSSNSSGKPSPTTSNIVVIPDKKSPKGILRPERYQAKVKKKMIFDPFAILLDASLEGEFDLVKDTIRRVPNPSRANDEGITALHNAVCAGHTKIVEFLVHQGVDINAADADGWTPLHCAASCNNTSMVKFLVENGACIFAQTISDRGTAADKCEELEDGYVQCSEYLLGVQEKMGVVQKCQVYGLYDYDGCGDLGKKRDDELVFNNGDLLTIVRKSEYVDGNPVESEWWWAKKNDVEGYLPRNYLGLWPRIKPRDQFT